MDPSKQMATLLRARQSAARALVAERDPVARHNLNVCYKAADQAVKRLATAEQLRALGSTLRDRGIPYGRAGSIAETALGGYLSLAERLTVLAGYSS